MSELGMGVVRTYLYVRVRHGSGEDVPLELGMGVVRTYLYVSVRHGSGEDVPLCQS